MLMLTDIINVNVSLKNSNNWVTKVNQLWLFRVILDIYQPRPLHDTHGSPMLEHHQTSFTETYPYMIAGEGMEVGKRGT